MGVVQNEQDKEIISALQKVIHESSHFICVLFSPLNNHPHICIVLFLLFICQMKWFPHLFSGPKSGKYDRNLNGFNSSTRWSWVLGHLEGGKKKRHTEEQNTYD